MDLEAFDKLGVFGPFMILVLLKFDSLNSDRLNSTLFHSTVSTTTLSFFFF